MHPSQLRNKITLSFLISIIFILLQIILFWNSLDLEKSSPGIWPFISLFFAVLALAYNFNLALKATNSGNIDDIIEEKVSAEKIKILKEFEKEEEKEVQTDENKTIEEKIQKIIPAGKFKTTEELAKKTLKNLADNLNLVQGTFYLKNSENDEYSFLTGYALTSEPLQSFKIGENLNGQVAETGEISYISDIPEEYFKIESGLGEAKPKELIIAPVVLNSGVLCVFELASFSNFDETDKLVLEGALKKISEKVSQTIRS